MKTVDLLSTQNVQIEHQTATFGDRLGAWLIDATILAIVYITLNGVFAALKLFDDGASRVITMTFLQLFPWLGVISYHFLCETMWGGQSVGKRALGIIVAKLDGTEATFGDHFVRAIFLLLDVYCVIGALVSLVSHRGQRIGDFAANTAVVRIRGRKQFKLNDIEGIKTRNNYVPQFPQVVKLNEQDLIIVKQCLNRYDQKATQAHFEAIVHLSNKIADILDIVHEKNYSDRDFLRTILSDYIVLTRS